MCRQASLKPISPVRHIRHRISRQVLFLDGHTSRWSIEGLSILKEANVLAIALPSHTSIWSQVSLDIFNLGSLLA